MKQTGIFRKNQVVSERLMDRDLEKERNNYFNKPTSIIWKSIRVNIDTPGHLTWRGSGKSIGYD